MSATVKAMVHSLNALDNVTILEHRSNNDVIAQYGNKVCTAVFNPYVCLYYVDDEYGVIKTTEDTAVTK